jgi:hypothetical protein
MPNHFVFISYARKDYVDNHNRIIPNNIVSRVQNALRDAGISYWIDEEGLQAGDAFPVKIAQQIEHCQVFLFISTENSNQSPWVINEIATAHHYHKPIIPLRYDHSPYNKGLMIYLAGIQYIDYTANPKFAISNLVAAVQNAVPANEVLLTSTPITQPINQWFKRYFRYILMALVAVLVGVAAYLCLSAAQTNSRKTSAVVEDVVYITAHGECYHADSTCHTIRKKHYYAISTDQAHQLSKRPCSFCITDD